MRSKKYMLRFTLANGQTQELLFEVPPGEKGEKGEKGDKGDKGDNGGTIQVTDDGRGNVVITATGKTFVTDDGHGNVVIS